MSKQEVGFAQIKNEVLNDHRLSWGAKGLFAYLYSKPDDWDFSVERIKEASRDGKHSVIVGLRELEECGYLTRSRTKTGRMKYHLRYEPLAENQQMGIKKPLKKAKSQKKPLAENQQMAQEKGSTEPLAENQQMAETSHQKKKPFAENQQHKKQRVTNKEETKSLSVPEKKTPTKKTKVKAVYTPEENKLIAEVIDLFKNLNETHYLLFQREPQREAAKRLLDAFGLEKVTIAVRYLESVVGDRFAPVATTPCALEEKWGALRQHYVKHNGLGASKGINLNTLNPAKA